MNRVGRLGAEVGERNAHVVGEHAGELERRERAELDEDVADAPAGGALDLERLVELLVGDQAAFDQRRADAAEPLGAHGPTHGRPRWLRRFAVRFGSVRLRLRRRLRSAGFGFGFRDEPVDLDLLGIVGLGL